MFMTIELKLKFLYVKDCHWINTLRPEPPPLQIIHSWAPGDVLEVFQSCSWKIALVSKVLEEDCVLVRLLGSSLNVRANKSDIRVRQVWQYNEWIMAGQGTSQVSRGKLGRKVNLKGQYIASESKDKLNESIKGPKKKTFSLVEPHNQARQVEENGRLGRALHFKEEDDRESIASSVGSCNMDIYGLSTDYFNLIQTGNSSETESSSCGYTSIKKLGFPAGVYS